MPSWVKKELLLSLLLSLCVHGVILGAVGSLPIRSLSSYGKQGLPFSHPSRSNTSILNVSFVVNDQRAQRPSKIVNNSRSDSRKAVNYQTIEAAQVIEIPKQDTHIQPVIASAGKVVLSPPQQRRLMHGTMARQQMISSEQQMYYQQMMALRFKQAEEQRLKLISPDNPP